MRVTGTDKREALQRIKQEHELTGAELGQIMGCNQTYVFEYLAGRIEVPENRLRLLELEVGLRRPYWTDAKRAARLEKQLRKEWYGGRMVKYRAKPYPTLVKNQG